jgi:hypothetical protein
MNRHGRIVVLVAVAVGGLVMHPSGQTTPPRANRAFVPASATIEPLARPVAGGNTILRVRYEAGLRLPVRIPYATEAGTVVLADDGQGFDARAGDGLYTALGTMDLVAARDRIVRLSQSRTAMPTRTWRSRSKNTVDAVMDPGLWGPGRQYPWEPWGDPLLISVPKSLMIRHLGVVEDPTRTKASCGQSSMGVWSFGYLMEQMANTPVTGVTGPQFTRAWLERWTSDAVINGWTVQARTMMQTKIIDPWVAASGGPNAPLDLSKAPFRLLAIVNRMDLRDQVAYGGTDAGELRFVFASLEPNCAQADPGTFAVALEYAVPAAGCLNMKALATQWKALGGLPIGSPQYNAALEAITQQVVVSNAGGGKANGSALNQIRVIENLLDDTGGGLDWEAREFRIDPLTHLLLQDTVAQTPDRTIKLQTPFLSEFVNQDTVAINANDYVVPLRFPNPQQPFRGGSMIFSLFNIVWDDLAHPIPDRGARHIFGLNTCNGCHTNETDTAATHVIPTGFGTPAGLSGFMTGIWVNDPADGFPVRYFDELQRRAVDLDAFISESCFTLPIDLPLLAVSH